MSAYQVFQNAYLHAQLARPPDEEHTFPSGTMDMDEWDKLPPDCQAFIEILAHYGMDDDVGLFIYKSYPEIATRIGPTLRTGLIILEEKHIIEEMPEEFINNYITELAQIAIDGPENHTAPVTPETESKTTAMIRARAEAILEQAPARARISLYFHDYFAEPIPEEPRSKFQGQEVEVTKPKPETVTGPEPEKEAEIASIKPESKPPTKTGLTEQVQPPEKGDKPRNLPKTRAEIGAHQLQALLLLKSTKTRQEPELPMFRLPRPEEESGPESQGQKVMDSGSRTANQGQKL